VVCEVKEAFLGFDDVSNDRRAAAILFSCPSYFWICHTSRFGCDCPGLNVCPGVPSRLAKCPGISLQWNFQSELQPDDALLWNNSAQWPFAKLGVYCWVIFPLCSMELQQLLQLEAILYALRRQDNFQLVLSHIMLKVSSNLS